MNIRRAELYNERTSFEAHWRQLGDFILPRRPRFFVGDANRGDRRNANIIDGTASLSLRTLKAGMMSGITSPAKPWFNLTTIDPEMAKFGPVKRWLDDVTSLMRSVFIRSNLYNVLPTVYGDSATFATGAMSAVPDFDKILHFESYPIGSYFIAKSNRDIVNVFMREFRMTVSQLIDEFAEKEEDGSVKNFDNFSDNVRSLYEQRQFETWIDVVHLIEPNENYKPDSIEPKHKKFSSCYFEIGSSGYRSGEGYYSTEDKALRESGFDIFPVMAPRWEITGEDVYGTDCPGMLALGDIKQLQNGEKRIAQGIEKILNPTMIGPTSMRKSKISGLAGDVIFSDERDGQKGFRPTHEVDPRILELENKQSQIRQRISRYFFEDLFLMLSQSDRRQITAREITERHEEKLLALGPVLAQLNQDLLDPLIDITFAELLKRGMVPTPPSELEGQDLKVEYVSIMAQAQKLIGVSSTERFVQFVGSVAQASPDALDKINSDALIDHYAESISIPSSIVRTEEEVQEIRQRKQLAAQQQAEMERAAQMSTSAKELSETDISKDSALRRILEQRGVAV